MMLRPMMILVVFWWRSQWMPVKAILSRCWFIIKFLLIILFFNIAVIFWDLLSRWSWARFQFQGL